MNVLVLKLNKPNSNNRLTKNTAKKHVVTFKSFSVFILLKSISTRSSVVSPTAGGEGGSGRGLLLKISPSEDTAVSVTMDT